MVQFDVKGTYWPLYEVQMYNCFSIIQSANHVQKCIHSFGPRPRAAVNVHIQKKKEKKKKVIFDPGTAGGSKQAGFKLTPYYC